MVGGGSGVGEGDGDGVAAGEQAPRSRPAITKMDTNRLVTRYLGLLMDFIELDSFVVCYTVRRLCAYFGSLNTRIGELDIYTTKSLILFYMKRMCSGKKIDVKIYFGVQIAILLNVQLQLTLLTKIEYMF